MKRYALLAATAVGGAVVAFQGSVNLQATSPGTPQTGNSNITGIARSGSMVAYNTTLTGQTFAGDFRVSSDEGRAILGNASSTTGVTYGGLFTNFSSSGRGVSGIAQSTSGTTYGGFFSSLSTQGRGLYGQATSASGTTYGVYGKAVSPAGYGVYSEGNMSASGIISGNGSGLTGVNAAQLGGLSSSAFLQSVPTPLLLSASSLNHIIRAQNATTVNNATGLHGVISSTTPGAISAAVRGQNNGTGANGIGVYGSHNGSGWGGYFTSATGRGVYAQVGGTSGIGVYGNSVGTAGATLGVYGTTVSSEGYGVYGYNSATSGYGHGGFFRSDSGVGIALGAIGGNGSGSYGLFASTVNDAGTAVFAQGRFSASGTKSFRIDHPTNPENEYLLHYCAEGPDALNIYTGNAVTDANGYATINLPDYFEEINRDPRYGLTIVGGGGENFVQVRVVRKIRNNQFTIRTSEPKVEVSWEVKGVRNDRWVRKHGAPVEVAKEGPEKGTYQHPELYGQPKERRLHYRPEDEAWLRHSARHDSPQ
ncbi:MAG: hypothetical protein ABL949_09495 [Fimbriimonadaceae bacterium]